MILAVNDRQNAVTQHRLVVPTKYFPDQIEVVYFKHPQELSGKDIHAVLLNRSFGTGSILHDTYLLSMFREYGVKIIIDLDDYWELPEHHTIRWREDINYAKWQGSILDNLYFADLVWCTNKELKAKIKELHPDLPVEICRNALDLTDKSWTKFNPLWKKPKKKVHIGYVGGLTHYNDLNGIKKAVDRINKYHGKKVHWHHCGYSDQASFQKRVSNQIRYLFTSGKGTANNYTAYHMMPFNIYPHFYDGLDISISPLDQNDFNECKSELKAIESGVKGCAFIGEDIETYRRVNANLELVHTSDQWYEAIMYYVDNRDELENYKRELQEQIVSEYSLERENLARIQSLLNLFHDKYSERKSGTQKNAREVPESIREVREQ